MTSVPSDVSPLDLMDATQTRKRPRPVVSCLRCREKKLKCDRSMPCENCIKSGCSSDCMYNQSPASLDALPKAKRANLGAETVDLHPDPRVESGRSAGVGLIEDLQLRLARLEELLSVRPSVNPGPSRDGSIRGARYVTSSAPACCAVLTMCSSPHASSITRSASPPPFLGTVVVKGTRTRYHGQNNRISLLNQVSRSCPDPGCSTDRPSSPKRKSLSNSVPKIPLWSD